MDILDSDEHIDSASQTTLEVIKKRATKGIVSLTGRTFLMQIISLVSTIFLTIFLSPSEYGIFFLVSALVSFFAYFSDIGFAAALIQKKEQLTSQELKTAFSVQQLLVLSIFLIILVVTPFLQSAYKMDQGAVYLLWALAFSLFLSSLKTIPSVLLERKLDFNGLVLPQIIETFIFNLLAVFLAWKGYGITSFTIAVLARGFVGLILIYIIQPWRPALAFSKQAFHSLFKYGLPYQLNTFLAVFKDDGMTSVLGVILGTSGIGLLGWAQKWSAAPLRFFMDQVIKVTFPAFARMQDDKKVLSQAVSKSILFICLIVFPSLVLLILIAPFLTQIVPKYSKWQPAIFALTLISINSAWAAVTTPLTNLLNAIGKIMVTFKLMIMWTLLTWGLLPILAYLYGVNGAAAGFAIVGSSSIIAIIQARRYVDLNFWQIAGKPLLASVLMGTSIFTIRNFLPVSWSSIMILVSLAALLYPTFIYFLFGKGIFIELKQLLLLLKPRK